MLRVLLVACLVLFVAPVRAADLPAHPAYQSEELAKAAREYRRDLIGSIPAQKREPGLVAVLRRMAENDYQAKQYAAAVGELKRAIANGGDDATLWLRLAESQFGARDPHTLASAYTAYLKASEPGARGRALFVIGYEYDSHDQWKDALAAFDAGLALVRLPAVAERAEQLRRLVAFRVTKVTVEAEAAEAQACLRFNQAIGQTTGGKSNIVYGDFVRAEPRLDGIVTARGDTLCLDGMKHGTVYHVEILAGLPSVTGEQLRETFKTRIVVPDRKPSISFAGAGYVLPREGSAGLPITTVNVAKVRLRLLRINERNLVPSLDADKLTMSFSPYEVDEIIRRSGSLVWQGEMAISGPRNRAVKTAIPLKKILREKGPGIYLIAAERADLPKDEYQQPATNWVLVSNLGLAAYDGADGMAVNVRSLADGKPVPGVAVTLYARNNGELATGKTDAAGIMRIAGGLLRGRGGDEPFVVTAHGPGGDFNFLEIGRPAFDLSDRGVSGRPQPGPVDAFLYTDRGIYRPGETVDLVALVRDAEAKAIGGLPVILRLRRPDGILVRQVLLTTNAVGAQQQRFALARDARIGTWRAELYVDPKAAAIGSVEFRVEDFVPPQLKVELSAADQPIRPGTPFPVGLSANYYYGAPGAGLPVEAELLIGLDPDPFPSHQGYQFGLAEEKFTGDRRDIPAPATDDHGKATLSVALTDLPKVSRPLVATIRASVFAPSGRAVTETLTRPIRQRPLWIGLQAPGGEEAVPENSPARLDVIAVDAAGKRIAAKGLRFELLRETWSYRWYAIGGTWHYRVEIRDRPIEGGALDIGGDKPAELSRVLPAGRYRWEISDPKSGAQSSLRFHVGWWVVAQLPNVPDKLQATLDKTTYKPGDTAKLFIKAPFAGEAELAIASNRLISLRALSLPAGGTTIDIPVEKGWGSGVYALVSAYRPEGKSGARQTGPGRAVGVAWLGIDESPRTLAVSIAAPAVVRPRRSAEIPLKVEGLAPGAEAYVTLAAVDEAVLKLTEFSSPAPEKYYFGKRRLGVELRDLYGRLIDANANAVGVLRSGGGSFAARSVAGLPDKSSKVVALFSGLVRVGADGTARIRFNIPDFEGELRLMAVAVSADKLGSATGSMIVRDPVVTTVALPRFLAPGDAARIGVGINNLEGAAGDYKLSLSASGAGDFAVPVVRTVSLAAGGQFADGFTLKATHPGDVALTLALSGPGDFRIARHFTIGVRPAQAYQLHRFVGRLQPDESVTLDDGAAGEFLPGTAQALLTVSPHPDWDVPGLLRALDRYPYGCLEQTTSRALPLVYVSEVAKLWHANPGPATKAALARAIGHIAELQRADGSFGVWSDTGDTVPWLDAYASDFLLRAREHGNAVPDFVIKSALGWLHDYVRQDHTEIVELPAVAYAHYVLARAQSDDLPALRYFADTQLARLPTALAKAQLGAALALYGEAGRAEAAYQTALGPAPRRPPGLRYVDFGSPLRDDAGVLAFAAGNPALQPRLTTVIDRIAELFARAKRTSTQEQAWLLMAAEAAAKAGGGKMTVAVDGGAAQTRSKPLYLSRRLGSGAPPITVTNRGTAPAWRTVSLTGVPRAELPAEASGYTVSRTIYRSDGSKADLNEVHQTDLLVVVLKGTRAVASPAVRSLVVDLLPAGFEIETATVSGGRSTKEYSWLPKLSDTVYTEPRDDRFVAALDLPAGKKDFALAYIVRAVSVGTFTYPALVVEDMYDPETTGRTAMGKLIVQPR